MVATITFIVLLFVIIVGFIVYLKWQNDLQFEIWFEKVLVLAPEKGLTISDIQDIEEVWFWDYFIEGLTPEIAIDFYILDKF